MRYGLATGDRAEIRHAQEAGFDYVELPKAYALSEAARAAEESWPVEATNLFLGGEDSVAKGFSDDWWDRLDDGLSVLAELGVQIVAIGSGRQRSGDEGRFLAFAERVHFSCVKFGMIAAPENLRKEESDVGVVLPEFAARLAARRVPFTVDSYHSLHRLGPGVDWNTEIPRRPAHVHVGDLNRNAPAPDDADIKAFFARLRELGYDGRVTFEGSRSKSLPEIAASLRSHGG